MKPLTGDRIHLRPVEIEDLENLYTWENDAKNWVASNHLNPISRFFLEQYILGSENNIYHDKQLRLMIETVAGVTVGIIDLFDFDPHHRRAAVGVLIAPQHQRQGYGSEAIDIIKEYAKNTLNLKQLFCGISTGNKGSLRLFERKGFEITGTRKAWRMYQNRWHDEHFLQLLF